MLTFVITTHAIVYNPYDNSNPLSNLTHSNVHYLYIISRYVGYLDILHLFLLLFVNIQFTPI